MSASLTAVRTEGGLLPPDLLEEALHVKEVILAILDGGAEGSF